MLFWERREEVEKFPQDKFGSYSFPHPIEPELAAAMQDDEKIQFAVKTRPKGSYDDRVLVITNRHLFVNNGAEFENVLLSSLRHVEYDSKMLSKNSGTLNLETLDNRRLTVNHLEKEKDKEIADFLKRAADGRSGGKGAR